MPMPAFLAKGAFQSGTGNLTVPAPANGTYAIGDLMLIFAESANEAIALSSAPTWAQVANSPQGTGTAAAIGAVRLGVFWKIATSATEASVTITAPGNHGTAIMMAYSNCDASSILTTAGGVDASGTTSMSWPSVDTTGTPNCLIVCAAGMDTDAASTTTCASQANANLASIAERHDETVTAGRGGGVVVWDGQKATGGVVGASTATGSTSVTHAYLTIALKPGTFLAVATDAATAADSATALVTTAGASDGAALDDATNSNLGVFSHGGSDAATSAESAASLMAFASGASDAATPADSGIQEAPAALTAKRRPRFSFVVDSGQAAAVFVKSSGGNAPVDVAATDAATAADSATQILVFGTAATDAATPADSATIRSGSAAAPDAATPADSATTGLVGVAAASDAVTVGDFGEALAGGELGASDNAPLADSASATATVASVASDASTPADSGTAPWIVAAAASDAITLVGTGSSQRIGSVAASDAATAADSAVVAGTATLTAKPRPRFQIVADQGAGARILSARGVAITPATDSVSLGSTASSLAVLVATATDAASAADSATGLVLPFAGTATDAATPGDSALSLQAVASVAQDGATTTDQALVRVTMAEGPSEPATASDSASTGLIGVAAASAALTLGDFGQALGGGQFGTTDNVSLADQGFTTSVGATGATDAALLADSGPTTWVVAAVANDYLSTSGDAESSTHVLNPAATDAVMLASFAFAAMLGEIDLYAFDAFTAADSAVHRGVVRSFALDALAIGDSGDAAGGVVPVINPSIEADLIALMRLQLDVANVFLNAADEGTAAPFIVVDSRREPLRSIAGDKLCDHVTFTITAYGQTAEQAELLADDIEDLLSATRDDLRLLDRDARVDDTTLMDVAEITADMWLDPSLTSDPHVFVLQGETA